MDSPSSTSDESSDGRDVSPSQYLGPPRHPDDLGTLGRYRVLKQLGAGGMGAVFLGFDESLDRKVALKVMLPHHAARPTAKERFLREAKAAAKVKSDHVINLYEVGESHGIPFIAMEYLQGQPLDQFLKTQGNPTIAQILRIGREVATGLADAHALGLVHRDIKPANLWLEAPKGRVKILDFGLARSQTEDVQLTKSGAVVGTPAYMSPEQARNKPLDGRSDLFSLGGVLYRLCTGRLPFPGENQMEVLTRLAMDDPSPVRGLNPNVPEPLARIVHRLLAKKPEDRYATADDLIRAIGTVESTQSGTSLRTSAPILVDAQAESLFARLEDSSTQQGEMTPLPVAKKPKSSATKKPPWALVGGLSVGAVAVLIAAVTLFNKFRPKPEERRPESEIVERKDRPKDGKARDAKSSDPEPKKAEPILADPTFFNGKELVGWFSTADKPYWRAVDGTIIGEWPKGASRRGVARLATERDYGDFRLTCRIDGGKFEGPFTKGYMYAGILFRAVPRGDDESGEESWTGARFHIGPAKWGLVLRKGEAREVGPPRRPFDKVFQTEAFNDVEIICVSARVTVTINAVTVLDEAVPDLPARGRIGFVFGSGMAGLRVKDIKLTDLSGPSVADILTSPDWEWTLPENLGDKINTANDEFTPVLTADGRCMIYSSNRTGEWRLHEATRPRADAPFTDQKVLPAVGGGQARHPWLSADGLTLLFASARPGGLGGLDLWACRRPDRAAPWGEPASLGAAVNSTAEDLSPALSPDGLTLYFISSRPPGSNVYTARRPAADAAWGPAEKLAALSTGSERFVRALPDSSGLLVARSDGPGKQFLLATPTPDGRWATKDVPAQEWQNFLPALFGDGRSFFFDAVGGPGLPDGHGKSDLWVMTRVLKAKAIGEGERKAAEILLPHANLTIRRPGGILVRVAKDSPVPEGMFTITRIELPSGLKRAPFATNVLLPAFKIMSGLQEIHDTYYHTQASNAELGQLGDTPAAKSLTKLALGFQLTPDSLIHLRKFPNLTDLRCYAKEMPDDLAEKLVAGFPKLTALGLHEAQKGPTEKGWSAIARLPLVSLQLPGIMSFDPDAAMIIATMPMLEDFSCDRGQVADSDVHELSKSKSLKVLRLTSAPSLTDAGLFALRELKTLKTLEVGKTQVTAEGVAKFGAARPDVTVKWDPPAK